MFKLDKLLFCASILVFANMACNECVNQAPETPLVNEVKCDVNSDISSSDSCNDCDDNDIELDFIDELIEAPKNPDAKPSTFRIPDFVREYGMRGLEFIFYLKHSAGSKYDALITKLKTIYYRV